MTFAARRWLVGGGIVVLAVGTLALTFLALQHVEPAPDDREPAPIPTFSQPAESPSPVPTPSATPAIGAGAYDRAEERFLAVGDGVTWRGVAGACGSSAPLLERSLDAGSTWSDVTPTYLGIGQLIALDAFAGEQAEIVASMGDACEVQALRTFTLGQFWESYPEVLAASRFVDQADAGSVTSRGETIAAPCDDARGLRASGTTVALVCAATAYSLTPEGTWQALAAANAVALALDGADVVVAQVADGCTGIAVTRYVEADAARAEDAGCFADADASAPIAIAMSGADVIAWSADGLFTTTG
ncbi:hypothetical protein MZK47_08785 [Microbacterium aerolatum]|uniref:hypothetical protein n=1 Tax=Microbacterium aerolatum TaxID=153731 RepID=UPI002001C559|nr:hypothetical protein [Microbacterium aerolatum]MCK3769762.1 hypothetical protein [Microbacterium aerolatum]